MKLEEQFEKGWWNVLQPFLRSEEMNKIGVELQKERKEGIILTPKNEDIFRAFKECPWDKLNIVMLLQDPYPGRIDTETFVADGLATSSRYSKVTPKSLNYLYEAIDEEIFDGRGFHLGHTNDLKGWANQGILLLNCALTLPIGQKRSHIDLWQPFIAEVVKQINSNKDQVSWMLMGKYAKMYKSAITNQTHQILTCEHPAAAAYEKRKWNDENIFKSADAFMKLFNVNIDW